MSEPVSAIQSLLRAAARRSAWLAVARGTALAVGALAVAWAVATLAANEGARLVSGIVLAFGALGAVLAVGIRVRPLRSLLAIRGQAERVEAILPSLRGGLLTVVDRAERPIGSPALYELLAKNVASAVAPVRSHTLWPLRSMWGDVRLALVGLLALLAAGVWLPLGPIDTLRLFSAHAPATTGAASVKSDAPRALVGDITLRYLYPTYTRLDPLELPNTNGEIHAPPGTIVEFRARSAESYESASLQVYERVPEPAEVSNGRELRGRFTVEGAGVWRLIFGEVLSPDYAIVPDPDVAPEVATRLGARLRVPANLEFPLPVVAKDDYGLLRVVAEVTVRGASREVELRAPVDAPLSLADEPLVTAAQLGLRPGDVAQVRLGAWDNDAVSGSKAGWSGTFVLEIDSPAGSARRAQELRAALFTALVPPLADFLVDPTPLGESASGLHAWVEQADARFQAFDDVVSTFDVREDESMESRIVERVNTARRDLLSFARGLRASELPDGDLEQLALLQAANIEALEIAVYSLDQLQRAAAQRQLLELVEQLAREAGELRDQVPGMDTPAALARLDQLERLYEQVEELAGQLNHGGIREYLERRGAELEGAMAAARRDAAKGDKPALKADMERVAALLDEMAGGVEEAQKRQTGAGEELQAAMQGMKEELERLAQEQGELQSRTDAARDKFGQSLEEGLKLWESVDKSVAEALRHLDDPRLRGMEAGRGFETSRDDAMHDAEGLKDSARARDAETARDRAYSLEESLTRARSRLQQASRSGNLSPAEAQGAQEALERAQRATRSASSQLERLASAQQSASPELQEALESLSKEQSELAERAGQAAKRAEQLGQELPVDGSEIGRATREGARQAQRAGEAMEEGDAMGAQGGQSAAKDAFERAREALDQAAEDMQELQSQGGSGGEGQEREGEGGEGGEKRPQGANGVREISIPAPEEFETPEAYRKALLEGMQGEVPEAWRAANRRYYEELVRQ